MQTTIENILSANTFAEFKNSVKALMSEMNLNYSSTMRGFGFNGKTIYVYTEDMKNIAIAAHFNTKEHKTLGVTVNENTYRA